MSDIGGRIEIISLWRASEDTVSVKILVENPSGREIIEFIFAIFEFFFESVITISLKVIAPFEFNDLKSVLKEVSAIKYLYFYIY